jgi:hypothetical protein
MDRRRQLAARPPTNGGLLLRQAFASRGLFTAENEYFTTYERRMVTSRRARRRVQPLNLQLPPMKKTALAAALLPAVALTTLTGCVAAIGNHEPPRSTATLGQQLIDLRRARDSGAMTENEYQAQRTKFLAQK